MAKNPVWSESEIAQLREYPRLNAVALSKIIGRSPQGIRMMRKRLGLTRHRGLDISARLAKYKRYYDEGLSERAITFRTGFSSMTQRRYRERLGLPSIRIGWTPCRRAAASKRRSIANRKSKKQPDDARPGFRGRVSSPSCTAIYSDLESEYLRAIAAFRTEYKRPPTMVEGFRIALELGYRKETSCE